MFRIYIIGAGQIGSRHLQALKNVRFQLNITVVDPLEKSLSVAKQRYDEVPVAKDLHTVNYSSQTPKSQKIDLVIIATTSNVRAKVTEDILKNNRVRYLILEKILFDRKADYQKVGRIIAREKVKAWVNCPMRVRPVYKEIKEALSGKKISFRMTGSQWGLATNAIHYLDFISHLTGSASFTVDTSHLEKKVWPTRRKGFVELHGTLFADFTNGSHCELTEYNSGNAPWFIEILNQDRRYLIQGLDKIWNSHAQDQWQWKERAFKTPLVSETTTGIAEDLLKNGRCALTPYQDSVKIHLALLEPLRLFLNKSFVKKYNYYPFT